MPFSITLGDWQLSRCYPTPLPASQIVYETSNADAIAILRRGFDPSKTTSPAPLGDAVYITAHNVPFAASGKCQLMLSLDLRKEEIAYINDTDNFLRSSENKKIMALVRKLFLANGYRAVKYSKDGGGKENWAVFDPSCISILKVKPAS